jgi:hypothetical protein
MKKIITLFFCIFLFGISARAMQEEETSGQKVPTVSKAVKEPDKAARTERELNDELVERGDKHAIQHKIEGLSEGTYGYEKKSSSSKGTQ